MSAYRPVYAKFSYDENARNCSPNDFLGQSMRTIHGKPVPQDHIDMIMRKIKSELELSPADYLLDLPCGNGSLSWYLFDSCRGYLGVDISDYLVSVAQSNFQKLPDYRFRVGRAPECLHEEQTPSIYTKMLIYAGIQYFPDAGASELLSCVRERFENISTIFIGNIPDRDRREKFYKSVAPSEEELNDPETAVGIWRTQSALQLLAGQTGWDMRVSGMPAEFYASAYRFDALLTRA